MKNEEIQLEKKRALLRQVVLIIGALVIIIGAIFVINKVNKEQTVQTTISYQEQVENLMYDLEVLVNDDEKSDADKIEELRDFIDNYNNGEEINKNSNAE
jgi:hypothetical protein